MIINNVSDQPLYVNHDVVKKIMGFLDIRDITYFGSICKELYALSQDEHIYPEKENVFCIKKAYETYIRTQFEYEQLMKNSIFRGFFPWFQGNFAGLTC